MTTANIVMLAVVISLKRDEQYMSSIGIDIGGSKIALGLVEQGKIVCSRTIENSFFGQPEEMVTGITEELNYLHDQSASMVEGVGVGCPGWVIGGTVYEANNIGIKKFDLRNKLALASGLRVCIENDARTALLCEWKLGALRESTNGALVTFGTGIGGALLLNKRLYTGSFRLCRRDRARDNRKSERFLHLRKKGLL